MAALGDVLDDVTPDVAHERLHLLAVCITHLRENVWFYGTLVSADLEHLHLHADLVEEVLVENGLRRDTVPVEHAAWVQHHAIGNRTYII